MPYNGLYKLHVIELYLNLRIITLVQRNYSTEISSLMLQHNQDKNERSSGLLRAFDILNSAELLMAAYLMEKFLST